MSISKRPKGVDIWEPSPHIEVRTDLTEEEREIEYQKAMVEVRKISERVIANNMEREKEKDNG